MYFEVVFVNVIYFRVIDDQNEQIWADDIVKREKETNQNVKTLQNDVALERGMKERELEERQQQLSELKIKVRKLRHESAENYERKKGETEARAEAQVCNPPDLTTPSTTPLRPAAAKTASENSKKRSKC